MRFSLETTGDSMPAKDGGLLSSLNPGCFPLQIEVNRVRKGDSA